MLLQSYLQHMPSNPEAHDHPCARQPCLALSPTKCNKPSVKRRPRYPGKLPKLQLQQLHPLVEFGCFQVHLFGSPVKSHHPSCSSRSKTRGGIDKNLRKNISLNINLKYGSCRYCMLSNNHQVSFQKKTRQHVRIVHRAIFFVRLYLTNKLPNLASNLSQCCIFQSTCI